MLAQLHAREPLRLSVAPLTFAPLARASIGARRNPQSTRAILAAAGAILRERGVAGFSIDAVARLARCGKPTVYRWWPDKLALLLDLHNAEIQATPPDAEGDLRDYWDRSPAGVTLRAAFAEAMAGDDSLARFRERVLTRYAAIGPARALLGDWLMGAGDGQIQEVAPAAERKSVSMSVRHRGEWVD